MKKTILLIAILLLSFSLAFTACRPDNPTDERTVQSISIESEPTKLNYVKGDALSLDGGQISVKYDSGKDDILEMNAEGVTVSPMLLNEVGAAIAITVTYKDKSDTFTVNVSDSDAITVQSISIEKRPDVIEYFEGDTLLLDGGKIRVKYDKGAQDEIIDMTATGVIASPMTLSIPDDNVQINVYYQTKTAKFGVKVHEAVTELTLMLETMPTREYYFVGNDDVFSLEGGEIRVLTPDKTTFILNMTDVSLAHTTPLLDTVGAEEITFTYTDDVGAEAELTIEVQVMEKAVPEPLMPLKTQIETAYLASTQWFNNSLDDATDSLRFYRGAQNTLATALNSSDKLIVDTCLYLKCIDWDGYNDVMTLEEAIDAFTDDIYPDFLGDYADNAQFEAFMTLYLDAAVTFYSSPSAYRDRTAAPQVLEKFLALDSETTLFFFELLDSGYVANFTSGNTLIDRTPMTAFHEIVITFYQLRWAGDIDTYTIFLSTMTALETHLMIELDYASIDSDFYDGLVGIVNDYLNCKYPSQFDALLKSQYDTLTAILFDFLKSSTASPLFSQLAGTWIGKDESYFYEVFFAAEGVGLVFSRPIDDPNDNIWTPWMVEGTEVDGDIITILYNDGAITHDLDFSVDSSTQLTMTGAGIDVTLENGIRHQYTAEGIKSISIEAFPDEYIAYSGEYFIGGAMDLTGGKIKITYNIKDAEIIDMTATGVSVFPNSFNTRGQQLVTVMYSGKSTTFPVLVIDPNWSDVVNPDFAPYVGKWTTTDKTSWQIFNFLIYENGSVQGYLTRGSESDDFFKSVFAEVVDGFIIIDFMSTSYTTVNPCKFKLQLTSEDTMVVVERTGAWDNVGMEFTRVYSQASRLTYFDLAGKWIGRVGSGASATTYNFYIDKERVLGGYRSQYGSDIYFERYTSDICGDRIKIGSYTGYIILEHQPDGKLKVIYDNWGYGIKGLSLECFTDTDITLADVSGIWTGMDGNGMKYRFEIDALGFVGGECDKGWDNGIDETYYPYEIYFVADCLKIRFICRNTDSYVLLRYNASLDTFTIAAAQVWSNTYMIWTKDHPPLVLTRTGENPDFPPAEIEWDVVEGFWMGNDNFWGDSSTYIIITDGQVLSFKYNNVNYTVTNAFITGKCVRIEMTSAGKDYWMELEFDETTGYLKVVKSNISYLLGMIMGNGSFPEIDPGEEEDW